MPQQQATSFADDLAALRAKRGEQPAPKEGGVTQAAFEATRALQEGGMGGLGRYSLNALPSLGGAAFSLAAGGKKTLPGMGMAALGGAAGEGARQTIEALTGGEILPPSEALKRMGAEAGVQAGAEVVGRTIGASGRELQRQASGTRLSDVQAFGDVAGMMAKERIPVGPGMDKPGFNAARQGILQRGGAKADALRTDAAGQVTQLLSQSKAKIDGRAAIANVDKILEGTQRGTPGTYEGPRATIRRLRKGFADEMAAEVEVSGGMTAARAHELKTFYADKAATLYDKSNKGVSLRTAKEDAELQFYKAAADGLRAELAGKVPGYAPLERRVQGLMGASRVVNRAEMNRYASHGEFGAARVPAFKVLIQLLSDPAVWSRVGLTLDSPIAKQALRLVTPMASGRQE